MVKKLVTATSRFVQIAFCILLIFGLVACAAPKPTFQIDSDAALRASLVKAAAFPEANFVVFSDPHLMDPNLGMSGKAFEDYIVADRKLIRESPEILDSAITSISALDSTFVLCPGDMTKDGELASHMLMTTYLARLKASGKKVYVVPGNHDIKNGRSYRYVGDLKERVPNISAADFAKIYADYGFNDALQRDSDSLSYLVEPVPGLWLLALDSARYRDNVEDKEETVGGRFSAITFKWIEDRLAEAAKSNKAVIVMMHHGVVEHYPGQAKNYGDYLVDDYKEVGRMFAAYNVRMVFTGHYHAQNIAESQWSDNSNTKFIFDVETGSLVTYPCPYRIVKIGADQSVAITSEKVMSIKSHPQDFQEYARQYLIQGISGLAVKALMGYGIGQAEAQKLSGDIAAAFAAHYAGDAHLPAGQAAIQEQGLSPLAWVVIQMRKDLILGLWTSTPPPDNNVTLDMKTGGYK
jgi:3',5'-cyclic AMP phosphodiesterase CpdA